jgi:MFS family permease
MLTVWSLATMLGAIPLGYHFLLMCRMLVGAAEAGVHPACLSLIADYFPPKRRATAVSIFATGTALASYVVYLVGGWLLVSFGWHAVFLLAGIPGILLAIVMLITLREPPRGRYDAVALSAASERKLTLRETALLIARTRPMLHAITAHMLATGVQWAIVIFIVALMTRVHGLPLGQATVWVGIAIGTFQTIGSLGSGPIIDWIGRGSTRTLAGWLTCMAVACLATGMGVLYAPTAKIAIAALCAQTLCAGMLTGPSYALLIATSPPRARGSSISLARLLSSLIGNSGLGFFAGFVSDLVGGPDSIRVGLAVTMLFFAWSSFHYLMVRRLVAKESTLSADTLVQA